MLQLNNNTPFATEFSLFPNEEGIDTLYLMVKATFNIGSQWSLTNEQPLPIQADEYWGDVETSSIKQLSDFHLGKKSTDIIMNGHAIAPHGKAVNQLDVSLHVGKVSKTIRIFGDRQWNNGYITAPIPFQTMPLVYERAYGGQHILDNDKLIEQHNPVGLGFVGKRSKTEVDGLPLPNLEDPSALISAIKDTPKPACFAGIAPFWAPRNVFAGTYDQQWQQTQAPFLPDDFDKCFFNAAHADLIYPEFLVGGEQVTITHMHEQGNLTFTLPHVQLKAEVDMADKINNLTFNCETLLLSPNDLTLSMVWRASLKCDKKALKIKQIKINLVR
jgi:hypothetical protein